VCTLLRRFGEQKRLHGTDFVATEFGFPSAAGFGAPLPYLFVTVMREPVSRLVSNFFWRFRRHFGGLPEPRLTAGAKPDFAAFALHHRNFYVRALAGAPEPGPGGGAALTEEHLSAAQRALGAFSVVLICEWLGGSAGLLERHLGWRVTDFEAFHEKKNTGLKVRSEYLVLYLCMPVLEHGVPWLDARLTVPAAPLGSLFSLAPPGLWAGVCGLRERLARLAGRRQRP